MIHKLQYIIHTLQLHYSSNSDLLSVNYRCITVGQRKQLWVVEQYLVSLMLQEITVGHIARGRLHVTEFVFPDGAPWLFLWSETISPESNILPY
jgi:hypothetical protein